MPLARALHDRHRENCVYISIMARQLAEEDSRPVEGILTGTALGVAFWLIVLLIVAGIVALA
jgi:hypothetical protein